MVLPNKPKSPLLPENIQTNLANNDIEHSRYSVVTHQHRMVQGPHEQTEPFL